MILAVATAKQFKTGSVEGAIVAPWGPAEQPRTIGPFAVLVHVLPFEVAAGELPMDFDVRPHPHIGLAAVSYILDGHITHRDSLGSRIEIAPGDLAYLVAGKGVVHSERFDRLRVLGGRFQMFQILLALPDGDEDVAPSFVAIPSASVPRTVEGGATTRSLVGAGAALAGPTPMFLHDVVLEADARHSLPDEHPERAVYVLSGEVEIEGTLLAARQTALLGPGATVVRAAKPSRILAFGGKPVGPRYVWWNFIHSSLARLEEARDDWRAGRVTLPPGDTESFTPAPPDQGRPLRRFNAPD